MIDDSPFDNDIVHSLLQLILYVSLMLFRSLSVMLLLVMVNNFLTEHHDNYLDYPYVDDLNIDYYNCMMSHSWRRRALMRFHLQLIVLFDHEQK